MNLDFFTADVGGCTLMNADEFGFFTADAGGCRLMNADEFGFFYR
jgi:hypothetical protein